jgi:hypothetical protein
MVQLKPLILYCCIFILAACTAQEQMPQTPQRPESVPSDAMWIGGIDGGAWVLLKKNESDPAYIYYGEIYGDQAGDRWYIGKLEVVPHTQPVVPLHNPEVLGVWDGDNLLLKDGRKMRAIETFDPFKK